MKFIKDLGIQYTSETKKYRERYWLVECGKCHDNVRASAKDVKLGKIKQCKKCSSKEFGKRNEKHKHSSTKIYRIYAGMIQRCYNNKRKSYRRYGGRGIAICDEWLNDFELFYSWCLQNEYDKDLTIDRIDNNGNYEPSNCRFASKLVQCSNRGKMDKKCSSKYKGVSKIGNRWISRIRANHKPIYLGSFKDESSAAIEYNRYIEENNLSHEKNNIIKEEIKQKG